MSHDRVRPLLSTSIEKMCRGVKGCRKNFAMKCFVFLRCTCSALYCSYLGCLSTQTRRAFGIASILVLAIHFRLESCGGFDILLEEAVAE